MCWSLWLKSKTDGLFQSSCSDELTAFSFSCVFCFTNVFFNPVLAEGDNEENICNGFHLFGGILCELLIS